VSETLTAPGRVEVPDAAPRQRGLRAGQRDAVRAIAATLFATEDGPPDGARLDWLCDDLDDFLGRAGPRARGLFSLCVTAVTWLAPWRVGALGPFESLDEATRTRALERMERGAFGLAVFGAKAVLCIVWYEHPEVARAVGYDGRCLR
jgi:hypothetical protein